MFKKSLILYLTITVLTSRALSVPVVSSVYPKDTAQINDLLRKAQKLEDNAIYDSAVYYYQIYSGILRKKDTEKYLMYRNKIITLKRSAGQYDGLLAEALENLGFCKKKFRNLNTICGACSWIFISRCSKCFILLLEGGRQKHFNIYE